MNREEIITLAIECGDDWYSTLPADQDFLIRFAALVAAAERDACAKVAEDYKENCYYNDSEWYAANTIFNEIRKRGEE